MERSFTLLSSPPTQTTSLMAQSGTQWNLDNIAEVLRSDVGGVWDLSSTARLEASDVWFEENSLMGWPEPTKCTPDFTHGSPLVSPMASPAASPIRFFRKHSPTSPAKRCYGGAATLLGKRRAPAPTPPPSPRVSAPTTRPREGGESWRPWASRVAGRVFVNSIPGGAREIAV